LNTTARGRKASQVTILIAYDGSPAAEAAVAAAGTLLATDGAEAVVLSVWEPIVVEAVPLSGLGPLAVPSNVGEADRSSEDAARELAERGAGAARAAGLEARAAWIADADGTAEAIVAAADDFDARLIVLGSRGLTGVRAALGSVSQHVLRHAKRPVLVVPEAPG
jgi:nucleotide-binding universal stress UspA family protein